MLEIENVSTPSYKCRDYKQLCKCGLSGAVVCAVQMSFHIQKVVFLHVIILNTRMLVNLCQFNCTTVHF